MIPLARRFCVAMAVLFAAAAIPVWLHAATGRTFDPCADPDALAHLPAYGANFGKKETHKTDGEPYALSIEGELTPPEGAVGPLRFWVLRGAEPHLFFGGPDKIFLNMSLPSDRTMMHALAVGSDVLPLHRRYDDSLELLRFSEYVLIQGTTPVSHPLVGGVSRALPQLTRGTEPVTMLLVQGVTAPADAAKVEASSDAWLAQAWTDYREACLP